MTHHYSATHCNCNCTPPVFNSEDPPEELITLRDWLRYTVSCFDQAGLYFGHGCNNAFDEALWLNLRCLHLPAERLEVFLDASLTNEECHTLWALIRRRCVERIPTAYLIGEAWIGNFRFAVDPRVIIPRSYFGELLENSLTPWLPSPDQIAHALDLCTGSGCLAILLAHAFPCAQITAVELSEQALDVARLNVEAYDLTKRIDLVQSDLFAQLNEHRFDLIISNPPYVTAASMAALPAEYHHEPSMALVGGDDGMEIVRRILAQARKYLKPHAWLAVEVGHNREQLEAAFPDLPLIWLSSDNDDDVVFLIQAEHLPGQ